MYLCRRYSILEWRCNLLMNNLNSTGYPLIYRLLSNIYSCVFISFIGIELHLKTKVIMKETPSPYRWLGYMFVWMMACILILYQEIRSDIFIIILLLLAIVINSYCAYKFALEKGTFLAILAFVVAMILDFFPYFLYFFVMWVILA